jgi:urease accessory protein
MDTMDSMGTVPLVLTRRRMPPPQGTAAALRLPLAAEERTRLRGRRRSGCGVELLLQLPRGEALEPGEWLAAAGEQGPPVQVEAAPEALLVVRSVDRLELLRAAYHLGNRHVALEVRLEELRLLDDPVLARRGLLLERCQAPFLPEGGAYAGDHGHHHHDHHDHHHPRP